MKHLHLLEYKYFKCNISKRELLNLCSSPAQICDSEDSLSNTSYLSRCTDKKHRNHFRFFFLCHTYTNYQKYLSILSPKYLLYLFTFFCLAATMPVQNTVTLCVDSCLLTGLPASGLTYL